jgi:hypothetical protein
MKKLLFLLCLVPAFNSIAQKGDSKSKDPKIDLKKGQSITVVSTKESTSEMSGMPITANFSGTNTLTVTDVDDKNIKITNTLTKVNVTMDAMGQQTSYDSEKESDKDSELGKALSAELNKPITFLIDKSNGKAVAEAKVEKKAENENPMKDIMGPSMGGDDMSVVEDAIFLIPGKKKAGDSWSTSDSTKEKKTTTTYTLKSIDKESATVTFDSKSLVNTSFEAQGMQMTVNTNSKVTGEIILDPKTGSVKKKTSNSEIEGALEVMGQNQQLTSKVSTVTTYTY